jgi:hypothetical protein
MKLALTFPSLLLLAVTALATAQDDQVPAPRADFRYSLAVIEEATFDSSLQLPLPASANLPVNPTVTLYQNQLLLEPSFTLRYRTRWSLAASATGLTQGFRGLPVADFGLSAGSTAAASALSAALAPYTGTHTTLRVKESYAGLSAGDFDFMLGRRLVRWGVGYAFTTTGVLDPPRDPTNPSDRLNLNQGRDMVKADWVRGPHALTLAWSSAALAPAGSNLHDTTAFRYNILVHGFDTSMIAGNDRGGDAFGGLTFTRVFGQAWELHGESAWREHEAILLGAKYTTARGVSFIGEFYTPPNIPYYRDSIITALASRQYYGFLRVSKSRLRELPGWKQWDLSAAMVNNMNDKSFIVILDATRRLGSHFSSYLHMEIPQGGKATDYGATPYTAATSAGVRFQL